MNPAGQTDITQLPTGLPTGPLVQSGSSVTPEFVAFLVAGVIAFGGLAYYLTRSPPADNEETTARASARRAARLAYRSSRKR